MNFSNNFIKWLHSYLSNRTISITDGSTQLTSWQTIKCGVPQGSVMGPILYILYANDLFNRIKHSKVLSYVDDTQIYLHCHPNEFGQAIKLIKSDANAFFDWCDKWV